MAKIKKKKQYKYMQFDPYCLLTSVDSMSTYMYYEHIHTKKINKNGYLHLQFPLFQLEFHAGYTVF